MLANNDLDRVIRAIPWNGITVNGPTCNEPKSFCRFIATTVRRFPWRGGGEKDIYISIFYPVRYFLNVFLEELANL